MCWLPMIEYTPEQECVQQGKSGGTLLAGDMAPMELFMSVPTLAFDLHQAVKLLQMMQGDRIVPDESTTQGCSQKYCGRHRNKSIFCVPSPTL